MTRLLFVAVLALVGCDKLKPTGTNGTATVATASAKKTYTRAEFKALVVGKTPEQVIAAVGKPDSTQESSIGQTWYYRETTVDPITGKADATAQLVFENGIVDRINF